MLTIQQIQKVVTDYFKDKPVTKVYLFGSYARGEATESSDVDLLVEYDDKKKKISLFDTIRYKLGLEDELQLPVELIEEKVVYHRFLPYVQQDKIKIYEA